MIRGLGNIDRYLLRDTVFAGLAPYDDMLRPDFALDRVHASVLEPRDDMATPYDKILGSQTAIEAPHITPVVGWLDIVVLPPQTGTGNYRKYDPRSYQANGYPVTGFPIERRIGTRGVLGEVVVGIATFDPKVEDARAVMNALHLERTTVVGNTVVRAAIVGQSADEFEESIRSRTAGPNTTLTVAGFDVPGVEQADALPPVHALFNPSTQLVQVAGLISITEGAGTFYQRVISQLAA